MKSQFIKDRLNYLFYAETKSYTYYSSKEEVIRQLVKIFDESGRFFKGPDIIGRLTGGDTFTMHTTGGYRSRSNLYGAVMEVESGVVKIDTMIESNAWWKVLLVLLLVLGLVNIVTSIIYGKAWNIFFSVIVFLVAPVIINWFAGMYNDGIRRRFEMYVHKKILR